jgi:hypothetical protein
MLSGPTNFKANKQTETARVTGQTDLKQGGQTLQHLHSKQSCSYISLLRVYMRAPNYAHTRSVAPVLMVPPMTGAPTPFHTGSDSPVCMCVYVCARVHVSLCAHLWVGDTSLLI